MVVGGAAHGLAELPDAGTAGRDPVPQGTGFFELAEEGGPATQPVELFGRLASVLCHGRHVLAGFGKAPWGGGPLT